MYVVKRITPVPPGSMAPVVGALPPVVEHAAAFDPDGRVTSWTVQRERALRVTAEKAQELLHHELARQAIAREVGTETFCEGEGDGAVSSSALTPLSAPVAPLSLPGGPRPTEDDLREAIAEIERQREVIAWQAEELDSLRSVLVRRPLEEVTAPKSDIAAEAPVEAATRDQESGIRSQGCDIAAEAPVEAATVAPQKPEPRRPRR